MDFKDKIDVIDNYNGSYSYSIAHYDLAIDPDKPKSILDFSEGELWPKIEDVLRDFMESDAQFEWACDILLNNGRFIYSIEY